MSGSIQKLGCSDHANLRKQGRIHDIMIRCVLVLHYAIFSDFHERVTGGPTDRRTDTPSYRDARTHLKRDGRLRVRSLPKSRNQVRDTLFLSNGS